MKGQGFEYNGIEVVIDRTDVFSPPPNVQEQHVDNNISKSKTPQEGEGFSENKICNTSTPLTQLPVRAQQSRADPIAIPPTNSCLAIIAPVPAAGGGAPPAVRNNDNAPTNTQPATTTTNEEANLVVEHMLGRFPTELSVPSLQDVMNRVGATYSSTSPIYSHNFFHSASMWILLIAP